MANLFNSKTTEMLIASLQEFAQAQDRMAALAKEDSEHWHHAALSDLMKESAIRLTKQEIQ